MSLEALLRMSEIPFQGDDDALDGVGVQSLFHRLNNQLGIILAHAELLEAKATADAERAHAARVVDATLESMNVLRALRQHIDRQA